MGGMIGREVRRKEDERLVTGAGCFADDLAIAGAAHAVFVRSPHAHAILRSIYAAAARSAPGVLGVFTGADLAADGLKPIPHATGGSKVGSDMPLAFADGSERLTTKHMPLPTDKVRFPGEAVCIVVAESRSEAEAAAELVEIDYDSLPACPRAIDSLKDGAPSIWDHVPGNLLLDATLGDKAATDAAFGQAAHRVKLATQVQRVTGVHMEPRASAAVWDSQAQHLTLHASHGIGVVQMRSEIAAVMGLDIAQVRIAAPPDVGGNFGTRNATYPEFCCIAYAARKLNRPVRQATLRSEAFLSDYQARDLHVEIELALDESGKFLAVRSSNVSNVGAHTASFVALNKGLQLMTSVYDVPVAHLRGRAALSNTPSTIPYRSAGRPEAMFVIERLVDVAARQCGFDRVELRRRNLIRADAMPYRNPAGVTYDNGDYRATMERVLDVGDWKSFPARRADAKARGKLRGIGVANYVETTSGAPRERAEITIGPDGSVDCIIGTQASGQGHETSFSMLIAEWLGVPFDSIDVRYGDTAFVQAGGGSHSGRSMRFASLVIRNASLEIIEKGKKIAGAVLEAAVGDISFEDGVFRVTGTDRTIGIFEIAAAAQNDPRVPEDLRGPLGAISDKITTGLAYPFGAQVVEIEIDPDSGAWEIVRYTALDDVGRAINPLILHGQTHGGIAQGAGQALMEQCFYEPESGQMLTASFMDYAMPRASDFPFFATELSETPATSHPLGLRPGGEGGTTPALAACTNAIVDALSDYGVTHMDMPATPLKIWKAIQGTDGRNPNG